MQILSHRGRWRVPSERNTLKAFSRSFADGYGTELDVRDDCGELVVSHDPPPPGTMRLDTVLRAYVDAGQPGALAINVKSDGLAASIAEACERHGVSSFFCFDQSVPDLFGYLERGVPTFTRQSEVEPSPPLYDRVAGVWLDSFFDDGWFDERVLTRHLDGGKRVCMVSPELHGREPVEAWERWVSWAACDSEAVLVCTDRPDELSGMLR